MKVLQCPGSANWHRLQTDADGDGVGVHKAKPVCGYKCDIDFVASPVVL